MTISRGILRACSRFAVLAAVGIGLAGCYNVDATLTMKPNGTSALTSRLDFQRDAKHVAELYKAIMELQPGMGQFFDEGLCHSVEKLAAKSPQLKLNLKSREYTTEKRFGCGFLYEAGDTAALIDKFNSAPTQTGNILKIKEVGPRRVRIELHFNNVPDLRQMMPGLIMLGVMKYGSPGQGVPNMEAIEKISRLYVNASLAMARMAAPNNHLQIAIKAANVIDTNGEQDGDLVKFRWSWEEFARLMLKQPGDGQPDAKIYYAEVEY